MNISTIIGMSSLIDDSSLVKWEFMSGEVMDAIPLYGEEYSRIGNKEEKTLKKAKTFLDSALQGMTLKDNHNGALPRDYLMSSRTFEISLRVLLSSPTAFGIEKWESVNKKLNTYSRIVSSMLKNKKITTTGQKKNIDEIWMFFKTLADISRKKRTVSIFSHEN